MAAHMSIQKMECVIKSTPCLHTTHNKINHDQYTASYYQFYTELLKFNFDANSDRFVLLRNYIKLITMVPFVTKERNELNPSYQN